MVRDQAHYQHSRYPFGQYVESSVAQPKGPSGPSTVTKQMVPSSQMISTVDISAAAQAPKSHSSEDDFNPLEQTTYFGEDIAKRFRVFYEPGRQGKEKEPDWVTIGREGDLVTLKLEKYGLMERYAVDLEKGGCLVAYDHSEGAGKPTVKWRSDLQCVAGVWIPARTNCEETRSSGMRVVKRLEWVENAINEPIPDDEYSLVKLGVHEGDEVHDQRTGTRYTVTGSEFPPADDGLMEEQLRRPLAVATLRMAGGALLLLVVAAAVWMSLREEKRAQP